MRAVVVEAKGRLAVDDVPDPEPNGRALVSVETVGLCGTDVKILSGAIPVQYPRVLGHEVVGTVVEAGERAAFPPGTRVLIDPVISCDTCWLCRSDRTHLCRNGALMGRDVDGGFAELIAVDEVQLHGIPEGLGPKEVSLLQVLGTCVHAQTLVDVFPGQTAAVVGLGVSGLLHLQLLLARGVDRVIGVTRSGWKRDLGKELGAVAVAVPDDAPTAMEEVSGGRGADLVVEASGTVDGLKQSVALAAPGSTVLLFGTITESRAEDLRFYDLYYKELDLVGSRAARPRDYDRAIDLAAAGALRLAPLWSGAYPLEEAEEAFGRLEGKDGRALKVTLEVAGR